MSVTIRVAVPGDEPRIQDLMRQLAVYEKLEYALVAKESDLADALFGVQPVVEAILAWDGDRAIGYALYYRTYSTFLGKPGLYLEDLFVVPDARGKGAGKMLLARLAAITVERGYGRLEWAVLNWNEPAIGFYKRLGAEPMDEWTVNRLAGDALTALAASAQ